MAGSQYCTPADLYDHGLPRGALPNPARMIADIDPDTEILTLDGHGLRADAELVFRAESGGSMPSPLVAGVTYYAIPLSESTFSVASSPGGSAINLTSAGSRVVVVTPLPVIAAIEWASAMFDDFAVGHPVPLSAPYPVSVIAVVAQLAIAKLLSYTGQAPGTLSEAIASAQKQIERWGKGVPIRGAVVPASANLAIKGSGAETDPRGWCPPGGGIP